MQGHPWCGLLSNGSKPDLCCLNSSPTPIETQSFSCFVCASDESPKQVSNRKLAGGAEPGEQWLCSRLRAKLGPGNYDTSISQRLCHELSEVQNPDVLDHRAKPSRPATQKTDRVHRARNCERFLLTFSCQDMFQRRSFAASRTGACGFAGKTVPARGSFVDVWYRDRPTL